MKNLRYRIAMIALALIVLFIFGIEVHYLRLEGVPFPTRLILFILLNLNLIALLTLMFFVGKSIFRIYTEKKERVTGYRFKLRFVVVLVVLTLIPSAVLFIVSSGIITNYLDRWFEPQIKQPLNLSIEIAKSAYEMERQHTLEHAKAFASGVSLPDNYRGFRMSKLPENASETIRAGFDGRADVEVITDKKGDIIRAVVPEYRGKQIEGIIVVETTMHPDISKNAEAIKESYRNYQLLESWKLPIKVNYFLIVGFFTLLILFMALWIGLRLSRGITDPIQRLALATERVAKGSLEESVDIRRDDEIGLLADSFNNMVREIRESRESLQRTYAESERRRLIMENILDNINSGVISLDTVGNILTVNNAACRILNVRTEDVINKNYSVLLSTIESEELEKTIKGIKVWEFRGLEKEIRAKVRDKNLLLRLFITSLRDQGNFVGTLVVFDDLTEIARAQKALAWQEVAKRIAHEIKNPLTPIKLSTDHMIKKWINRDEDFGRIFERSTKTIIKEVESLKRLVDEFSRFGKMPEIKKTPTKVSTIIENVINLYRDYKDIEIKVTADNNNITVELDEEQFKRVMINIVENAIYAMHNKGCIEISLSHDIIANRVFIDIADNGPGIRDEDRERLFLPYFSTKKDGTGLGLAIASKIIAEHRGYIRIRDNKPHGTIFTIELPIREG